MDSPLRKENIATEATEKAEFEGTLGRSLDAPSESALESEVEDEDTIHVDERPKSSVYATSNRYASTDSLGYSGAEEGDHDEHVYHAPILAADEVAKEPFGYELQPAISPLHERRGSLYDDYHYRSGSASSLSGSRPTSRPGSIHGTIPGFRVSDSTPLEDLDEYEPLFPEERSANNATPKKPETAADKLKRPELKVNSYRSCDGDATDICRTANFPVRTSGKTHQTACNILRLCPHHSYLMTTPRKRQKHPQKC